MVNFQCQIRLISTLTSSRIMPFMFLLMKAIFCFQPDMKMASEALIYTFALRLMIIHGEVQLIWATKSIQIKSNVSQQFLPTGSIYFSCVTPPDRISSGYRQILLKTL